MSCAGNSGFAGSGTALCWIVPAKAEGSWQLGSNQLTLTQKFQTLNGTLGPNALTNGRLTGDQVTFSAGGTTYTGTVMDLCQTRRGEMHKLEYLSPERVELVYRIPLAEVVIDFFDQLKSRTQGYASLDYDQAGYDR